jgi:hypothetical protein
MPNGNIVKAYLAVEKSGLFYFEALFLKRSHR